MSEQEFDAILERIKAAGIQYRSTVRGPIDMKADTQFGGRGIYWNEPEGHQWENADRELCAAISPPSISTMD